MPAAQRGDLSGPPFLLTNKAHEMLGARDWSQMTVCHVQRPQPATDAGRPEKGMSTRAVLSENPEFLPITY